MEKLNLLAISLPNDNEWHLIAKKMEHPEAP
jgi:hypothetical protein